MSDNRRSSAKVSDNRCSFAGRERKRAALCPCCGAGVEGDMEAGCAGCGARRVGPPLPRPERELPAYGHAFFSAALGLLLASAFVVATALALFERDAFALGLGALLAAAERAAWRLKWTLLPAAFIAAWACARLNRHMRRAPSRFVGHGFARAGLALSCASALALALFVVASVPERLRRRELGRRAGEEATLYATDRVLFAYRARFGTYPSAPADLRRLPDPDGSVAATVALLQSGSYAPEAEVASLAPKGRGRRRAAAPRLRSVSARGRDDSAGAGLSLTSYELTLPGRDKVLGTADDLRLRDGVPLKAGDPPRRLATPTPV
ncbi:MAG TPA: hypothetical protein VF240_16410 [Pyrinomonadaceae bacterium]